MKRILSILLLASLLLAGCGGKKMQTPKTTEKKAEAAAVTEQESQATEEPRYPNPSKQEALLPPEPEEAPAEPPAQPETPQAPTAPQQPTPPQQPATPPVSGRPTSVATRYDTGSNQIWDDPDVNEPTVWEVEADPERTQYIQWLAASDNAYFYYIDTDGFYMYPGRVYGVPLITSVEMFMATTWSISDPTVAEVNQVGYVVPLNYGEAVITATYVDPETQEATVRECEVTVRDYPRFTIVELEQRAHSEAKQIAEYALNYEGATTDLERIAVATTLVNQYVKAGRGANVYGFENGMPVSKPVEGYNRPFGTLVTFHSSCAGDTRALGLVLQYMGFEWFHQGENQRDHQWCVVYDVDGQTAFADASAFGIVGYGERKDDRSNWLQYRYGGLVSFQ